MLPEKEKADEEKADFGSNSIKNNCLSLSLYIQQTVSLDCFSFLEQHHVFLFISRFFNCFHL